MKRIAFQPGQRTTGPTFVIALLLLTMAHRSTAQSPTVRSEQPPPGKAYFTNGGEWIFSGAVLDVNGSDRGSIMRFAPVFNVQGLVNYDVSDHFGTFIGLGVRNLGFIYDVPDSSARIKFRTYTLGVPMGFKVGTMHKGLFFAGYELELPFNYKEKLFVNEKKEDRFSVWFSDRTEPLYHSFMVGFQTRFGATIKFKYYLTNFHNTDFQETKNGATFKPYAGLNSNVMFVSLGFGLFSGEQFIFERTPPDTTRDVKASRR